MAELRARIRSEDKREGLAFGHSAESLEGIDLLNMTTEFGDLDLSMYPAGTGGYADLRRDAISIAVRGVEFQVASLEDIIRSKEAADRPRDRAALPLLRATLEAIQRSPRSEK